MKLSENVLVLSGSYFSAVGDSATLGDVYGIRTDGGLIIIDCGPPITGPAMLHETLDSFGIKDKIAYLILTHGHWDHAGGAKELQDTGAKVIVGKEDAPYCTNGGPTDSPFGQEQSFPPFVPDFTVANDHTLDLCGLLFEFIKIPGHTPGSLALRVTVDNKVLMFTGDALQPDGILLETLSLGWQGDPGFSRQEIVQSMQKLSAYKTDMLLPGHGKLCLRNGTAILKKAAQEAFLTLR